MVQYLVPLRYAAQRTSQRMCDVIILPFNCLAYSLRQVLLGAIASSYQFCVSAAKRASCSGLTFWLMPAYVLCVGIDALGD
jgi:hypothetical protein